MPASILNAWVASSDRLIRYPCVNGHYTEGITSTTGVPEGCSISVLSMIATSTVYASELQRWPTCICWQLELDVKTAKSPFWSFWENTSSCADHAFSRYSHWSPKKLALEHLQTFFRDACEMMDPIDGVSPTVKTCVKDVGELVHKLSNILDTCLDSRRHTIDWIHHLVRRISVNSEEPC